MKILLPLLVLLASCGASHKLKTSVKKTVDSAVTTHRDTATVSQETTTTDDLSVRGVDITVNYGPTTNNDNIKGLQTGEAVPHSDTVAWQQYYYRPKTQVDKIAAAIRSAITSSGNAGRIQSVSIHIDSLTSASATSSRKDSSAGHSDVKAEVKKNEEDKSKEVTRSGMPLAAKLGLWMLIIAVIVAVVYRYRAKFIAIKDFFFK